MKTSLVISAIGKNGHPKIYLLTEMNVYQKILSQTHIPIHTYEFSL